MAGLLGAGTVGRVVASPAQAAPETPDHLDQAGQSDVDSPLWHVVVVNDGRRTTMYVDGCRVLRNPSALAVGIPTTGESWLLGAYHHDRIVEQSFYGWWLGDVRVVRPLPVGAFMHGRRSRPDGGGSGWSAR